MKSRCFDTRLLNNDALKKENGSDEHEKLIQIDDHTCMTYELFLSDFSSAIYNAETALSARAFQRHRGFIWPIFRVWKLNGAQLVGSARVSAVRLSLHFVALIILQINEFFEVSVIAASDATHV